MIHSLSHIHNFLSLATFFLIFILPKTIASCLLLHEPFIPHGSLTHFVWNLEKTEGHL